MTVIATSTASGGTLRLAHKPFKTMTRQQKIRYLHRQLWHDHSIIRFAKNHPFIDTQEMHKVVRWAHVSIRIVTRNLRALTRVVTYAGSGGSVPAIICRVFGSECVYAKYIAWRESRYQVGASNGTHWGLFQLDASAISAYARGRYSTALDQVLAAKRMRNARGWEPWTCCEG